jgi:hypothetical protein
MAGVTTTPSSEPASLNSEGCYLAVPTPKIRVAQKTFGCEVSLGDANEANGQYMSANIRAWPAGHLKEAMVG